MTTRRTSLLKSGPFAAAFSLAVATLGAAQGPCLDLSPNNDFLDDSHLSQNTEHAVRVTNGGSPISVEYIEMFTAGWGGMGRLRLRAHDAANDRPGAVLGSGGWRLDPVDSWQGAVLDSPVAIGAGEVFWVSSEADRTYQLPAEPGPGTDVYWWSSDAGQSWNGPFVEHDYKFRFFCYTPATVANYGSGCGGSTGRGPDATFFERFDVPDSPLDLGSSARFTPSATGWTVAAGQGSFDPNYSGPLGLGDDQLSVGHALGFDFPLIGGGTTSTIDIDSNGSICLLSGQARGSDYDFSAGTFGLSVARIAAWDLDLNPGAGGEIYFHTAPGRAVISWVGVLDVDESGPNTFQIQLFPSGEFVLSYGVMTTGNGAVGYSQGGVPGLVANDITDPQNPPLQLSVGGVPTVGGSLAVSTGDIPSAATLAVLGVGFLPYESGIDLAPIGMPHCSLLTRADVLVGSSLGSNSALTQLTLPNDPSLLRLRVFLQANALVPGANRLGLVLSDGVRLIIGQ